MKTKKTKKRIIVAFVLISIITLGFYWLYKALTD